MSDEKPKKPSFTVDVFELVRAIEALLFCASRDDTRPHLNGLLFKVEGGRLTLAATNGHVLGVLSVSLSSGDEAEFMLRTTQLTALLRILKTIRKPRKPSRRRRRYSYVPTPTVAAASPCVFTIGKTKVRVASAAATLFVEKSIDEFPPYQKIMPKRAEADGRSAASMCGFQSNVLLQVLNAARRIAPFAAWTMPRGPLDPVLLDLAPSGGDPALLTTGYFIAMPARVDFEPFAATKKEKAA